MREDMQELSLLHTLSDNSRPLAVVVLTLANVTLTSAAATLAPAAV